jgi:hypothetical protein
VVGQFAQLRIVRFDREDCRPHAAGVVQSFEQLVRCSVVGDNEDGLVAGDSVQPAEVDGEVRRGAGRYPVAHKGRRELGSSRAPGLLVEVSGQVPGLFGGGADDEQSTGSMTGSRQRGRERAGFAEPGAGEPTRKR